MPEFSLFINLIEFEEVSGRYYKIYGLESNYWDLWHYRFVDRGNLRPMYFNFNIHFDYFVHKLT